MNTSVDDQAQAPLDGSPETTIFEGRPALIPSLPDLIWSVLTVGLFLIYRYTRVLGTSYRITTRRVVLESGVLSKSLEQVDLYRVTDYAVERPFLQRVMGTGNLVLHTVDRTASQVTLKHVKADVVSLYERVRSATEADRARRGVKVVDYE